MEKVICGNVWAYLACQYMLPLQHSWLCCCFALSIILRKRLLTFVFAQILVKFVLYGFFICLKFSTTFLIFNWSDEGILDGRLFITGFHVSLKNIFVVAATLLEFTTLFSSTDWTSAVILQ